MATFRRETRIDAPLDEVWRFHSTVEGLVAITPDWMGLRVESATGPDGDPDPEILTEGSSVTLSIRPFGVGPRQSWSSRIVRRERSDGRAVFEDEMVDGPFTRWHHRHGFERAGAGTRMVDRVEYALPPGGLGRALSPLAAVGFEPMFRYRHRRARTLLAGDGPSADG